MLQSLTRLLLAISPFLLLCASSSQALDPAAAATTRSEIAYAMQLYKEIQ